MRILFYSSFIHKSHNGAAIFAQLFLQWAEESKHHVDVISIEEKETFIKVEEPISKTPIIFQKQLSKNIYTKICELDFKSYDLIYFNNVIEASHTVKKLEHKNIKAFLHDSQYMNDVYPDQNIKRKYFRRILKNIERKTIKKLKEIHTNSKQMKNQIHSVYNIELNKINYLYFSSFDLEKKESKKNKEFTILFIKTNYLSGGLITLLNACKKLNFKNKIIAIGPDESVHDSLKEKYSSLNLELLSYVPRNKMAIYFSQSDVFITPAFTEPMGIGNLEAMEMEIPVIGNNVEGVKEIAEKSDAILLFEKNNAEDLAIKITELKQNPKLQNQLIENGKRFVKEELNKKRIFQYLDEIII